MRVRDDVAGAATRPTRQGAGCRAEPGFFRPRVNLRRCEGKGDCAVVCPYGVFEIRRIEDHDFQSLPWASRLKLVLHGRQVAYTPAADACKACGACVSACPERAIELVRLSSGLGGAGEVAS